MHFRFHWKTDPLAKLVTVRNGTIKTKLNEMISQNLTVDFIRPMDRKADFRQGRHDGENAVYL